MKKYLYNSQWVDIDTLHSSGVSFSRPLKSYIYNATTDERAAVSNEIKYLQGNEDGFTEDMYKAPSTNSPWRTLAELRGAGYDISRPRSITKVADYLYEIEYDNYNVEDALYYLEESMPNVGACSSVQVGTLRGRNLDWKYDHCADVVVKTKAKENRHATVGVASSMPEMTMRFLDDAIESGVYMEKVFAPMPYCIVDGVNDAGLCVNINVVPVGDKVKMYDSDGGYIGYMQGRYTDPKIKHRYDLADISPVHHTYEAASNHYSMIMIPRLLLDNCATIEECKTFLQNNDFCGYYPTDQSKAPEEFHFMISEADGTTAIVEFDSELGVIVIEKTIMHNYKDGRQSFSYDGWGDLFGDNPIMTNYLINWRFSTYSPYTQYAMGIEREKILETALETPPTNIDEMMALMRTVNYTGAYTKSPRWYSEFHGQYSQENLTIDSEESDFSRVLGIVDDRYANRSRDTGLTWQTVHTACYDTATKTLKISVQERLGGTAFVNVSQDFVQSGDKMTLIKCIRSFAPELSLADAKPIADAAFASADLKAVVTGYEDITLEVFEEHNAAYEASSYYDPDSCNFTYDLKNGYDFSCPKQWLSGGTAYYNVASASVGRLKAVKQVIAFSGYTTSVALPIVDAARASADLKAVVTGYEDITLEVFEERNAAYEASADYDTTIGWFTLE